MMLVAQQRDGSEQRFAGCYITHEFNLHPLDIPQEDTWPINQATIAAVAANALIPELQATQRDGSRQLFSGGYVMRKANVDLNNTRWHIYSAKIAPAAANASILELLAQGCST